MNISFIKNEAVEAVQVPEYAHFGERPISAAQDATHARAIARSAPAYVGGRAL